MLIHLNLTDRPLPKAEMERARQATLDLVPLPIRKYVSPGLDHRVISVKIESTPGETVAGIPLVEHQWRNAAVFPWIDLAPGARALIDAVRARRGYTWPVMIKHLLREWWLIFSWDDFDRIVGEGE